EEPTTDDRRLTTDHRRRTKDQGRPTRRPPILSPCHPVRRVMTTISNQPDFIPLSMINALAYCPRRFGYEFIQSEMLVNEHVVEGTLRHQGVDLGGKEGMGERGRE